MGLFFLGLTGNFLNHFFIWKNSAKMVINADSYLLYDSCWTTKILTVYLRLIEKGKKKKLPVIEDKAVPNDEMW